MVENVLTKTKTQVDLNGLILSSPILTASGTSGYADELSEFNDGYKVGAFLTKAITLNPRLGNDNPRLFETDNGLINSIGLENIGIQAFLKEKFNYLKSKNLNYILNIAGSEIDEYLQLAEICQENSIRAVEINVSCPNVKKGCLEFGTNPNDLKELVSSVRNIYRGFLTVKLTPNVFNIEKLALVAQDSGANAVSAINTVKALGLKLNYSNGKFTKTMVEGGLSGKPIKNIALSAIKRISKEITIPIIGMGGIYSCSDMLEFFAVGASAVQVGTANFTNPDICSSIYDELVNFMESNNIKSLDELKLMLKEAMENDK